MDYSNYSAIEFRRKFWKIVGASITMTNPVDGAVLGFIKMKAWRLKEDITVFTDESMQQAVMNIKARQVIDFGATYDVTDSLGQPIISLRRKGLRSTFVRDRWNILDGSGTEIGYIQETSSGLALARRYLGIVPYVGEFIAFAFAFVPETFKIVHITPAGEQIVGSVTHRKNPVIVKMALQFSDNEAAVDKRIGVAATTLLSVVDAIKN